MIFLSFDIAKNQKGVEMTLKELSKITGYSMITISRALNNPEKLKKETLQIVLDAIERYNYKPNSLAQALVYKRTNIIYLYVPSDLKSTHPFVMQLISGIGSYAGEQGMSVLLRRTWYNDEPCDGMILVGLTIEDEGQIEALSKKVPVILFGHNDYVDYIDVDNYAGSRKMTEYIISKKYKHLWYIGIDQPMKFTKDRIQGHIDAIKASNLGEDIKMKLINNNEETGYEAGLSILKDKQPVDVIICASDYIAIGVIRAARQLGIKVPQELAVTGFDGLGFENLINPRITTVRQPIYEIGVELAANLVSKIKNTHKESIKKYIEPHIIENDSVL